MIDGGAGAPDGNDFLISEPPRPVHGKPVTREGRSLGKVKFESIDPYPGSFNVSRSVAEFNQRRGGFPDHDKRGLAP